jgi:hypothetical protein
MLLHKDLKLKLVYCNLMVTRGGELGNNKLCKINSNIWEKIKINQIKSSLDLHG